MKNIILGLCLVFASFMAIPQVLVPPITTPWQDTFDTVSAIRAGNGSISAPSYSFSSKTNQGFYTPSTSNLTYSDGGVNQFSYLSNGTFVLRGDTPGLGWAPANNSAVLPDVLIRRDAAGTLAQRDGVNPQAFRLYNTFTDASNYERLHLEWASNTAFLYTQAAGTGTARGLVIGTAGANSLTLMTNNTNRWSVNTNGHILPVSNDAVDIGVQTTNRVRNIYASKVEYTGFSFASIGSILTTNGDLGYCSDCTVANPCASGGTGAFAKRINSVNVCN